MKREYIPNQIHIDGRNIPYQIFNAHDYLIEVGFIDETEESFESFIKKENNYEIYQLLIRVFALKQSFYLMRRVSYSCGSLSDSLKDMINETIFELKNKYDFEIDEELVGDYS